MEAQAQDAPSGWPLGLRPITLRMRLVDGLRAMDSNSFITASPSFSSISSSDLDTESTLSFFPDKSTTLGTLIGIRTDPSGRRSLSTVHPEGESQFEVLGRRSRRTGRRSRVWCNFMRCASFSGCQDDATPSLGHFLQAERRTGVSKGDEKVYINIMYEQSEGFTAEPNPLFVESLVATNLTSGPSDNLPVIEESPERLRRSGSLATSNPTRRSERQISEALHRRSHSQDSCVPEYVPSIRGRASPAKPKANQGNANGTRSISGISGED